MIFEGQSGLILWHWWQLTCWEVLSQFEMISNFVWLIRLLTMSLSRKWQWVGENILIEIINIYFLNVLNDWMSLFDVKIYLVGYSLFTIVTDFNLVLFLCEWVRVYGERRPNLEFVKLVVRLGMDYLPLSGGALSFWNVVT